MIDTIYDNEALIRLGIFLSAFVALALWEWKWPKRVLTQSKLKRWFNNVALVLTSTLLVRIVVPMAAVGAAYYAEQHHLGFTHHLDFPLWLEFAVVLLLLDLSIYFQHAIFHVLPVMWRFHRVHHSDMDIDVSTGVRFHPVEILLSIFIKIILIVSWGAPVIAVILFEIVLNFMSMFTHSNIRLNERIERVLRWFIVTPDMHRIHHSIKENETNSNFSFHLSLWDRIFGTYRAAPEAGHLGMTIGLAQFRESAWHNYPGLLKMPFYSDVRGYTINDRDSKNEKELSHAKELALKNEEKAKLAKELNGYLQAVGQYALVSVADIDGNITDANDKFCQVSGYSREELLGQNHRIVNSGVHQKEFFEMMWSSIASGNDWHGEVCNRAKNGELYWVDSAIVPIKNDAGKIEEYVSVRVDITQRKNYELGIEQINAELSEANMKLESLSHVDALTGIANRRHFDENLANYINTMSRADSPLTLIMCDLDYLKRYNDYYGHQSGDECLVKIAKVIATNCARAGDIVARYAGDRFAIILPNITRETAMRMAECMRTEVESLALEHCEVPEPKVLTMSIGVVTQNPAKNGAAEEVIEKAEKALSHAKELGRNRVEIFS